MIIILPLFIFIKKNPQSELTETEPSGYIDYETTVQTSMETHLPESNIGYKLLQKMGWTAGKGLGPNGQGKQRKLFVFPL